MLISKATRMCYGSAPQREWRNPQTAIISAFRATRWIKTCGCWRISEVYYRRVMCDCSLPAPESIRIAVELSTESSAEPHHLQNVVLMVRVAVDRGRDESRCSGNIC